MNVLTSKTAVGCRLANACFKRSFYLYSPEPFHPLSDRVPEYKSAEEAVQVIQSDSRVYIHGAAATPVKLIEAMTEHGKKAKLRNVEIMHIHTEGPGTYNQPEYEGKLSMKAERTQSQYSCAKFPTCFGVESLT